jgi:hypothetical protein
VSNVLQFVALTGALGAAVVWVLVLVSAPWWVVLAGYVVAVNWWLVLLMREVRK